MHSFDRAMVRQLADQNVPLAVSQSLQAQRNKLAAASLPEGLDQRSQRVIEHAIGASFVHSYRLTMAIGATLAVLSAIIAWILIGTAQKDRLPEQ
jgi:hypothetical protein